MYEDDFFCPTLKLKEKQRLNSRYIKKYELPQTPYQCLIAAPSIDDAANKTLQEVYNLLNPRVGAEKEAAAGEEGDPHLQELHPDDHPFPGEAVGQGPGQGQEEKEGKYLVLPAVIV